MATFKVLNEQDYINGLKLLTVEVKIVFNGTEKTMIQQLINNYDLQQYVNEYETSYSDEQQNV